ncbi:MAG TPA: DUF3341 domain-containing protein [Fimbriimonadaceae bacterium]|nr:DUF3341 domain-containing protein [Fimbriimonadaceae bacterium]HRJ33548.1 DUF3341 domain-containing protein [Fimbriimonadaceae bacterium]
MAHQAPQGPFPYGIVAEFDTPEDLKRSANAARERGYTKMEAYSPFPIHGMEDAVGYKDFRIKWIIFGCACVGAVVGLGMQYWWAVIDYPMNVGGRPLFSWPQFVPVTFECTILASAFGAVFGMLGLNGLPKPYHPIFEAPNFERASQDRFFLLIEAHDPIYDRFETKRFLEEFQPLKISELEAEEEGHHEVA